jgi:hypothetical protein
LQAGIGKSVFIADPLNGPAERLASRSAGSERKVSMNKKLMLLAAGVLTALAFAAFPALASAGEYTADCELGAGKVCTGSVSGVGGVIANTKNETVSCTNVEGTATVTGGTSTGTLELNFNGCRETTTIFKFSCNSAGKFSGVITTGNLVSHIVNLADSFPNGTEPGILITNVNVTFECTGFAKKTVTGNVMGSMPIAHCNSSSASHSLSFTQFSNGHQRFTQVTRTGSVQDLTSNNHGGEYSTSSQTGSGTISWNAGNKVTITC